MALAGPDSEGDPAFESDPVTVMLTSPCTGVCTLDAATGWCLGCGRSGAEIGAWRSAPAAWRGAVWAEIPARLSTLGVTCRRLDWRAQDIRDFAAERLVDGRGTWAMGVVGASARMTATPDAPIRVIRHGEDIIGETANGAIRMTIDATVLALAFDPPTAGHAPRIVLAVRRERGRLPTADVITDLGRDRTPLIAGDGTRHFDLGLGRREARFGVRVGPGAAQDTLARAVGMSLEAVLGAEDAALFADSPTRVVETALGRIEVQATTPAPNGRAHAGPHTRLLPAELAAGRAMPFGLDLPSALLPGAIFYPPEGDNMAV